jgi:hypothetical protein
MVAIPRAGKPRTSEALQQWLTLVSITSAEEAEELQAIRQAECEASERLDNLEKR